VFSFLLQVTSTHWYWAAYTSFLGTSLPVFVLSMTRYCLFLTGNHNFTNAKGRGSVIEPMHATRIYLKHFEILRRDGPDLAHNVISSGPLWPVKFAG